MGGLLLSAGATRGNRRSPMFTTKQYRDKAAEYQVRRDTAITPAEKREYQHLEQRFTTLADNEQWLSDNHNKTVHSPG
jgi:hypothetical protein